MIYLPITIPSSFLIMANNLRIETSLGNIDLRLKPNAAPKTVDHIKKLVSDQLYDGCCFYRSDFVIQCGLQRPNGVGVENPHPSIAVNETTLHEKISNKRGTVSVAHWDVLIVGILNSSSTFKTILILTQRTVATVCLLK